MTLIYLGFYPSYHAISNSEPTAEGIRRLLGLADLVLKLEDRNACGTCISSLALVTPQKTLKHVP